MCCRLVVARLGAWRGRGWSRIGGGASEGVLALPDGVSMRLVAKDLGCHQDTVQGWLDRTLKSESDGIAAVTPKRVRKLRSSETVAEAIVVETLHRAPDDGSAY